MDGSVYELFTPVQPTYKNMNLKHFYNIVDETTGEMIYSGWAYSQESLLEGDFRKADYAIQLHEGRLKAQAELDAINSDHDCHLTPFGEDGCGHLSHENI